MSVWSRISNAVRGERLNREIEEELQAHIEEAIASGRDPDEARRTFGSLLRQREAGHSIRVAGWLESLLADVRFGWRQLWRNRVTSAPLFFPSLSHRLLCRRLPSYRRTTLAPTAHLRRQQALCPLPQVDRPEGKPIEDRYWATPDFKLMRDAVKDQADLIAISEADRTDITLSTDDDMEKANVVYVSGNMFPSSALSPRSPPARSRR